MTVRNSILAGTLVIAIGIVAVAVAEVTEEREARAQELLAANDIEYEGKYLITRFVPYKNGGGLVSVQQLHQGLLVFDSQLVFHFDENDAVIRGGDGKANLMGTEQQLDDVIIDPDGLISGQQASEIFSQKAKEITIPSMNGQGGGTKVAGPKCAQDPEQIEFELGIYKRRVVWRVKCIKHSSPLIHIDAVDGSVLSFDSGVRS